MTLQEILDVINNTVESEEVELDDIMEYEVEISTSGTEGIVSAIDVDIDKRQDLIKVCFDLV